MAVRPRYKLYPDKSANLIELELVRKEMRLGAPGEPEPMGALVSEWIEIEIKDGSDDDEGRHVELTEEEAYELLAVLRQILGEDEGDVSDELTLGQAGR